MNYKVMQRPMFRLGGTARKNFKDGSLEDLIKQRGALRDKAYASQRSMLPFSVLASQMNDVRTIRKPGDILNILSNISQNPDLFKAVGQLDSIDLKKSEGDLTDKIALAKLDISRNKKTATELKLNASKEARDLLNKYGTLDEMPANEKTKYYDLRNIATGDLTPGKARTLAVRLYRAEENAKKDNIDYVPPSAEDEANSINKIVENLLGSSLDFAEGGRVDYQEGTPNPNMLMPQPKPEEVMNDRSVDTLMKAAPAMEDPNEARSMNEQDMYKSLRNRLPPEITDDVVRLIAYNREAFTDFANISDQSDVQSFNQKYNVELVLPVGNQ